MEKRPVGITMISVGVLLILLGFSDPTGLIASNPNIGVQYLGTGFLMAGIGFLVIIGAFVVLFTKIFS